MTIPLGTGELEGRNVCQALLADEETPCTASIHRKHRYCKAHGLEYKALTRAYKGASKTAEDLQKRTRRLTKSQSSSPLVDKAAVDEAILLVQSYIDAIGEEIEGRRAHHKRFFQTKDAGHERWLEVLKKKRASAERSIARLRRQRAESVAGDARRREESLRRLRALYESQFREVAVYPEIGMTEAAEDVRRREEERRRSASAWSQQRAAAEERERARVKAAEDARRREEERRLRALAWHGSQRGQAPTADPERRPLPVYGAISRPAASWEADIEAQNEAGISGRAESWTCNPLIAVILLFIVGGTMWSM